jgi:hypothetical protein
MCKQAGINTKGKLQMQHSMYMNGKTCVKFQ